MSRTLIAALLLLIVSGSGAALSWYAVTNASGTDAPAETVASPTPTEQVAEQRDSSDPEPTSTPSPAPADPTPQATATPDVAESPTSLPVDEAPTTTPEPTTEPDDAATTPQWTVVEPTRWAPTRLTIPDIGVDARVVGVGLTDTGEMEAPQVYEEIGWYRHGSKPGEPGRAVFAGHVDSKTGPAVFYNLRDLAPGSVIEVTLGDNAETMRYIVRVSERYPSNEAPLDRIFGPSDQSELILITCIGDFNFSTGEYPDRLVVYADLAPEGQ